MALKVDYNIRLEHEKTNTVSNFQNYLILLYSKYNSKFFYFIIFEIILLFRVTIQQLNLHGESLQKENEKLLLKGTDILQ